MNKGQAGTILDSMIKFIEAHGKERVSDINMQMENDFTVQKEKMIDAEKKRLYEQFNKDLNIAEINLKIEKSAQANKVRIDKMTQTNVLVESLREKTKQSLQDKMTSDRAAYSELLKKLLVQGLIKLIERKITLRCRESDHEILQAVIDDAVSEYKQLMLSQVKDLEGKDDIPCEVVIDEDKRLPEYNEADPTNSCLGGFVMYARKNRIVCSQTLDDRVNMVYEQAVPAMRAQLFPCLQRKK